MKWALALVAMPGAFMRQVLSIASGRDENDEMVIASNELGYATRAGILIAFKRHHRKEPLALGFQGPGNNCICRSRERRLRGSNAHGVG